MEELKLYRVVKVESGYNWQKELWEKFYLAKDRETVYQKVIEQHGKLDRYTYDDEESHITIQEEEVILLTQNYLVLKDEDENE